MKVASLFQHLAMLVLACASTACQSPAPQEGRLRGDDQRAIKRAEAPERNLILERLSFVDLYEAGALLDRVASEPSRFPGAEGEGVFACRIEPAIASQWLLALRPIIESRKARESELYLRDPALYQRTAGLDRCSMKCSCSALSSVLKSVRLKEISTSRLRAHHRESLKKLGIKAARQKSSPEEICQDKQVWFCSSDLRELLESGGLGPRSPSAAGSP